MSQFALRPVASPVDIFTTPDVRMNDTGASELAQVSEALSALNPALARYGQIAALQAGEQDRAQILKDIQDNAIQNRAQLGEAVRASKIQMKDNPWYAQAANDIVTEREFETASRGWIQEYQRDQNLRNSTDLTGKDLDSFLRGKVRQFGEGLNSFGVLAIAPAAERFVENTVKAHVAARENEIRADVVNTAGKKIISALRSDGVDAAAVQTTINERLIGSGLSDAQIASVALNALRQAAMDSEDPKAVDALRASLLSVRVGSKTLDEILPPVDFKKMRDEVEQLKYEKAARQFRNQELADKKSVTAVFNGEAPASSLNNVQRLELDRMTEQWRTLDQRNADLQLRDKLWERVKERNGKITKEDADGLMVFAATVGASESAAGNIQQLYNYWRDESLWARDTDPSLYVETMQFVSDSGIAVGEKTQRINQLVLSKGLSKQDYLHFTGMVLSQGGGSSYGKKGASLNDVVSELQLRFGASYGRPATLATTVNDKPELTLVGQVKLRDLSVDLEKKYASLVRDGSLTEDAVQAQLSSYLDERLKAEGFVSSAEFRQNLPFAEVLTATSGPRPQPIPMELRSSIRFDGTTYTAVGGGKEVKLPANKVALFSRPDDMIRNFESTATSVGASNDDAKLAFYESQKTALKAAGWTDEELRKAASQLRIQRDSKVQKADEAYTKAAAASQLLYSSPNGAASDEDRRQVFGTLTEQMNNLVKTDPAKAYRESRDSLRSLRRAVAEFGATRYVVDPLTGQHFDRFDGEGPDPAAAELGYRIGKLLTINESAVAALREEDAESTRRASPWRRWLLSLTREDPAFLEGVRRAEQDATEAKKKAVNAALGKE